MDLLKRELAPFTSAAWKYIDDEARRVLQLNLAGRKLVDFDGPHGWTYAAKNTGRLDLFDADAVPGVNVGVRRVQPLVELRTSIKLTIHDLDDVERGAEDPNLQTVVEAAERIAMAEDGAIFNGYPAAKIPGIVPSSPHKKVKIGAAHEYPARILEAQEILRQAGINGPYAVALGIRAYDELYGATDEGYPIAKRIERTILDGPIVRAPAVDGAVVLSVRGGDYELIVGQDLAIGYADRDRHAVELFLTESFTFRVLEPAAAVHLVAG